MFRNEVHTGSKWKGGDFLHREALVSVAKSYTYDDGPEETGQDVFSREPFVVMFSSKHTGMVLWLELYSCFCITLIMMWILIQTFVRGSSWDMLVTSPLSFSCGVSASVTVNTLLRSLLFCSCERLYSDPSAHFPRISCSGAKCSLWRGGRCPRSLEQWCIYSLQVKIIYLVEKHTFGKCDSHYSPCRTSCCWVTSTQAVVMCPGLTGSRSASSLTRLSIGWSLMRPTLPCRKLSALTTGRQIVAGRSHVCTQTLNSNHLSVFAGLWSLRTWWEEWWKTVRRCITTWRTWISNKIW